ncbi:MAG: hypothetical protein HGA45_01050 [Chloroflexales bacterium]|nr:hypothetical protein [Chloroflexales bacterium]
MGGSVLALPIATVHLGPLSGVLVIGLLGLVNMLTISALSEACIRSGPIRFGGAYFGGMVRGYLGDTAGLVFSIVLFVDCFVSMLLYTIGIAATLAAVRRRAGGRGAGRPEWHRPCPTRRRRRPGGSSPRHRLRAALDGARLDPHNAGDQPAVCGVAAGAGAVCVVAGWACCRTWRSSPWQPPCFSAAASRLSASRRSSALWRCRCSWASSRRCCCWPPNGAASVCQTDRSAASATPSSSSLSWPSSSASWCSTGW